MVNRGGPVKGGDTESMRALAAKFDNNANEIDRLVQDLTSQLANTQWSGPDAQRFDTDWNSNQVPALKRATGTLRTGASQLRQDASQQDTTSA